MKAENTLGLWLPAVAGRLLRIGLRIILEHVGLHFSSLCVLTSAQIRAFLCLAVWLSSQLCTVSLVSASNLVKSEGKSGHAVACTLQVGAFSAPIGGMRPLTGWRTYQLTPFAFNSCCECEPLLIRPARKSSHDAAFQCNR